MPVQTHPSREDSSKAVLHVSSLTGYNQCQLVYHSVIRALSEHKESPLNYFPIGSLLLSVLPNDQILLLHDVQ